MAMLVVLDMRYRLTLNNGVKCDAKALVRFCAPYADRYAPRREGDQVSRRATEADLQQNRFRFVTIWEFRGNTIKSRSLDWKDASKGSEDGIPNSLPRDRYTVPRTVHTYEGLTGHINGLGKGW